jgi:hypothetical protein
MTTAALLAVGSVVVAKQVGSLAAPPEKRESSCRPQKL